MIELVGLVKAVGCSLRRDDRGTSLVEYGLLAVLLAIAAIPALIVFGPAVAALYTGLVGGP